jgi:hypothetical protein
MANGLDWIRHLTGLRKNQSLNHRLDALAVPVPQEPEQIGFHPAGLLLAAEDCAERSGIIA